MTIEYSPLSCCNCGVTFALNSDHMRGLRESHKFFYCPNGCSQHYPAQSKTEQLDRLKQQLEAERQKLAELKTGKCPFCWRTVKDLSSHIQRRHST